MSEATYHIGIDLGGTNIKFAMLSHDGTVIAKDIVPTDGHEGHGAVIARMSAGTLRLLEKVPRGGKATTIGVGVPGELDMETGIVKMLTNLPGHWPGVPCGPDIAAATGIPTYMINDVRAFTVAELELGAAKGYQTGLTVAVGTGIGGGVIINGKTHFGLGGAAGEIGHLIIEIDGPACSCGNYGCVEAYATGPAIISEANRLIAQGFTTSLTALVDANLDRMTPAIVEQAAEAGDQRATEILTRAGRALGLAIAGGIALIAPEVVVVGGGVARANTIYWRSFEATARANSRVTDIDRIVFKPAALGYDAGVIGAAMWGHRASQGES